VSEYDPTDDCIKSYYAAIEAKRLRGDAETDHTMLKPPIITGYSLSIDELAQALFRATDPTGVWAAADYPVQAHFRRQAQQKLTAQR